MSIKKIFILFGFLFANTYSIETNRTYLIKKDFVKGLCLRADEFTIYDSQGKHHQYYIRSIDKYFVSHLLYTFPPKTPIARIQAIYNRAGYIGIISIFDDDQWINGTITQNYKHGGNNFTIIWNENRILMEGTAASLNTQFIEESSKNILATFQKRTVPLFWKHKYDLQVLSNKYPDAIYFLGIAARDHRN